MGMTAGYEYITAESIYENAASADKDVAFVEGATHTFVPGKECEEYPGQFGDVQATLYDYIGEWLAKPGRFI
jgi:hypothetical protein